VLPRARELPAYLVDRASFARAATGKQLFENLLDRADTRERAGRVAPARAGGNVELGREVRAGARQFHEADQRLAQQLAGLRERRAAQLRGQGKRVDAGALAE